MSDEISDVAGLEACIGKTPSALMLKVVDHLDDGARQWLAASSLVFAAFGGAGRVAMTVGGGPPGFATVDGRGNLILPAAALDDPGLAEPGRPFGSLFLLPNIGETLRINGRVIAAGAERIEIAVEECFIHCAKALIGRISGMRRRPWCRTSHPTSLPPPVSC